MKFNSWRWTKRRAINLADSVELTGRKRSLLLRLHRVSLIIQRERCNAVIMHFLLQRVHFQKRISLQVFLLHSISFFETGTLIESSMINYYLNISNVISMWKTAQEEKRFWCLQLRQLIRLPAIRCIVASIATATALMALLSAEAIAAANKFDREFWRAFALVLMWNDHRSPW